MDTRPCANKGAGPQRGVDLGVSHRLEKGTSASEDAGPQRNVDCEIPHQLGRRKKHSFIKVWKPLPSKHVLKTLGDYSFVNRKCYLYQGGTDMNEDEKFPRNLVCFLLF